MHYGVLGPLRLAGPHGPVMVRGGRSPALTAWLVLHANQPVGVAETVEALWAADPPASAGSQVRAMARSLASLLGPETVRVDDRLVLYAADDAVDAWRFEHLIGAAQAHLGAGRPGRARANLEEALGLWRGEPYPELGRALPAVAAVEHLVELQLEATEDLHGVDLAGDVDYTLVAELRACAIRSPERERRWRQLAVGLYRCGRQTDAVAVLAQRREQADHRDPEASRLETAIVCHDPALDAGELAPEQAPSPPASRR